MRYIDDNVVDYQNVAFWQSAVTLGGASADTDDAMTSDYKNNKVFGEMPVGQLLVVVHEEGTVLGWRAWDMVDVSQPLVHYFAGGGEDTNICGASTDSKTTLTQNAYVPMTLRTFDADRGTLIAQEPLVYQSDCQLFANIDSANTQDYNRLSCNAHPDLDQTGNFGWGLGTLYDATHDASGNSQLAYCPTTTIRPLCDGQLHTDANNWGSATGSKLGGMIGEDTNCNGNCPWTVESGKAYDYAIYVRSSNETITYDSCEDSMEKGADSGAYLLSTGDWVYCDNDHSLGGWTLALNIDTSDGNVVDYQNYDFWESATQLGGAKDYPIHPFEHDYKNVDVFADFEATEIMVVLHTEGEEVLGYRTWELYTAKQPLAEYVRRRACGGRGCTACCSACVCQPPHARAPAACEGWSPQQASTHTNAVCNVARHALAHPPRAHACLPACFILTNVPGTSTRATTCAEQAPTSARWSAPSSTTSRRAFSTRGSGTTSSRRSR